MQTRRVWLAAAALALVAGTSPGSAEAQSNKVRIGYWTSGFSVGFGAVLELGKFAEKQGLEPEWVKFADVNGPTKALVTHSIDIAFAAPAAGAYSLAIQGAPVQVVLATQIAEASFVVREGSEIKSIAGLKGRKIGMSPVGSSTYALAAAVLERNFGLKRGDYTPVGGNEGQLVQFLQRGDVDAASLRAVTIASVPGLKLTKLAGMVDEWRKMTKSEAVPILGAAIMHKDFIAKSPDAAVKVIRALMDATEFGRTNNAEAAAFLKQASNLKAAAATAYAKLWPEIYVATMEPADVATFKEMAEIFRASGTIKGKVPDSLFNATLYEKAKQAQ